MKKTLQHLAWSITLSRRWGDQSQILQSRDPLMNVNRDFATRYKPLVPLKNRKAGVDFDRKLVPSSGTRFSRGMKWRLTCTRIMGRGEYGEGNE